MITIAIFSKPPVPGAAKTRLSNLVGPRGAAELASAFLIDTLSLVTRLKWARLVLATDGAFPADWSQRLRAIPQWDQGPGDLGAKMEGILRRGLEEHRAPVIIIGSDIPGLPEGHLEDARAALEQSQTVLGPAGDGGFYLIGVKRCPPGMLAGLPWSVPETFSATRERLIHLGMPPAVTSSFFDIDEPEDLVALGRRLEAGQVFAPATMEAIREVGVDIRRKSLEKRR